METIKISKDEINSIVPMDEKVPKNCHSSLTVNLVSLEIGEGVFVINKKGNDINSYIARAKRYTGYKFVRRRIIKNDKTGLVITRVA